MSLSPVDLSLQTAKMLFPETRSCARSDLSGVLLMLIDLLGSAVSCEKRKLKVIVPAKTIEKINLIIFNAKNIFLSYLI